MTSTKSPVSLANFFIFNPTLGPREGEEHKKILLYYPTDVDIDTKIKNIGLCEAIVNFTSTFTDAPCEVMHTQKRRQVFYQAEKNFWIVMTVTIPISHKTKDGVPYIEYHEDDVQDSVFQAVLKQAYKMFRFFMGPFSDIMDRGNVQSLIQRLEHFYYRYLPTLKLDNSDILDVFNGIHFLPLDKHTYLRIQSFTNLLEATFSQIKYTAFLYNDQLVWSGLEQDDMRTMYKYLTTSLFPPFLEQELQGSPVANNDRRGSSVATLHYGRYINGPPNMSDSSNLGKVPRVYINTESTCEECHLVVYRALSATVCLLVDASYPLQFDFYRSIDGLVGPKLSVLASDISEQYVKRSTPSTGEVQFKYIYFNHMNLAQKTTVHTDSKKSSNVNIPADILRLLSDINSDLSRNVDEGETIVKSITDCWVVGKKSDQREFYVVINQKNANLIEINEEVKRLCATNFNNIFFLD
ncbi:unnamed protein product [Owenia fusiformis]|uniref:Uncharacterized protein n=1 Tax=Owenia fusiformis TaxID=6347 RepID=A0A8J1U8K0_OWEFU|nr:unnamed protein product [Owenia fusiformis]